MFSLFVLNFGRAVYLETKLRNGLDASLISVVRLRSDALGQICRRWDEFGLLLGTVRGEREVQIHSADWSVISTKARDLERAISGYQGRVEAVFGVTLEANRIPRIFTEFIQRDAHSLGVQAEPLIVTDEMSSSHFLSGGWYRRRWRTTQPQEVSLAVVHAPMTLVGPSFRWHVGGVSRVNLIWDVFVNHRDIQLHGNGGFPTDWNSALLGNRVVPYRYPVFSAEWGKTL